MARKKGLAKVIAANAKTMLFLFLSAMIISTLSTLMGVSPIGQIGPTVPSIPSSSSESTIGPITMTTVGGFSTSSFSTFPTSTSTTTMSFTGISPSVVFLPAGVNSVAYGSSATIQALCVQGDNCALDYPSPGTHVCTGQAGSGVTTCNYATPSDLALGDYIFYANDLTNGNIISAVFSVISVYAAVTPGSQSVVSGPSNTFTAGMICVGPNSSCYTGDMMLSSSGCPTGATFTPSSVTSTCPSDLSQLSGYCELNNFAGSSGNLGSFGSCGLGPECYTMSATGTAYTTSSSGTNLDVCGYFQAQGSSTWTDASQGTLTISTPTSSSPPPVYVGVIPGGTPTLQGWGSSATVDSGSAASFLVACHGSAYGTSLTSPSSSQCNWGTILIEPQGTSCPSGSGLAITGGGQGNGLWQPYCGSTDLFAISSVGCVLNPTSSWTSWSTSLYPSGASEGIYYSQDVVASQTTTVNVCGYACYGVCDINTGQQAWAPATTQAALTIIATGGNPESLDISYNPATQNLNPSTDQNQVTFTAQCNDPTDCGTYTEIDDIGPGGTCQAIPYYGEASSGTSCASTYTNPGIPTPTGISCEVGSSSSVYESVTLPVTTSTSGGTDTICSYSLVGATGPTGVTCNNNPSVGPTGCWAMQSAQLTLNPGSGSTGGTSGSGSITPALQAICSVYYIVNTIVFLLALTLMILGGALYAGAQILPGQSRGVVQGYAMGLVFGGVAGAIIAMVAPYVLSIAYNSPANIISMVCSGAAV